MRYPKNYRIPTDITGLEYSLVEGTLEPTIVLLWKILRERYTFAGECLFPEDKKCLFHSRPTGNGAEMACTLCTTTGLRGRSTTHSTNGGEIGKTRSEVRRTILELTASLASIIEAHCYEKVWWALYDSETQESPPIQHWSFDI